MFQQRGNRFYVPQLDGLRFCAFLLVFVHHLPLLVASTTPILGPSLGLVHDFGWAGVDLFLCLSAFLITRLLLLEWQATERIRIVSFYVRRALRIWPLYFILLLVAFVVLPFTGLSSVRYGDPSYVRMVKTHGWAFPLFLGNWTIALHGYTPSLILNPLWTISLEEQFYLGWPLLASVTVRHGRSVLVAGGVMLLVAFTARGVTAFFGIRHPFMWASTITRLDPLALGIILASDELQKRIENLSQRMALAAVVVSGVLFGAAAMNGPIDRQGWGPVWQYGATAVAAACAVVGVQKFVRIAQILSLAPFRYLGKISYGLYMFHLVVIAGVQRLLARGPTPSATTPWATFMLSFVSLVLVGAVSYRYIEAPFLRLKERFTVVRSRVV